MLILNYQRMSTEDGPGLRTTLFVKGCPLKCRWCHNPESISFKKQVEWLQVRCMGCMECVKICPNQALTPTAEGIIIDREKCAACGKCIDNCPTGALEAKGLHVTVEQAYKELAKDKAYFGPDGGVTLSGGEIMVQAKEAAELLRILKEQGIGTAVDTCGLTKQENFDLVNISDKTKLEIPKIAISAVRAIISKPFLKYGNGKCIGERNIFRLQGRNGASEN